MSVIHNSPQLALQFIFHSFLFPSEEYGSLKTDIRIFKEKECVPEVFNGEMYLLSEHVVLESLEPLLFVYFLQCCVANTWECERGRKREPTCMSASKYQALR